MSYEPTNWKDGDLVTSAKLNKLEQGVASAGGSGSGGILVVHQDEDGILDRTWQEIHDADFCVLKNIEDGANWSPVETAYYDEDENIYIVNLSFLNNAYYFVTDNPNGYPAYEEQSPGPK